MVEAEQVVLTAEQVQAVRDRVAITAVLAMVEAEAMEAALEMETEMPGTRGTAAVTTTAPVPVQVTTGRTTARAAVLQTVAVARAMETILPRCA
jgi:hypothetical protein